MTHGSRSGVSHFTAEDDESAIQLARDLCDMLPSNNLEKPPTKKTSDPISRSCDKLDTIIPDESNKPYDVVDVISEVLDDNGFMEVQADWAQNIVIGFGHLSGQTVGVVANQPKILAESHCNIIDDKVYSGIATIKRKIKWNRLRLSTRKNVRQNQPSHQILQKNGL